MSNTNGVSATVFRARLVGPLSRLAKGWVGHKCSYTRLLQFIAYTLCASKGSFSVSNNDSSESP